ncbi:mannose-6-phosphate isomerase type 1 [Anaerobacterium chartisolvens]|uniref:mannose-6-phosphate isomerase n=1 Tax=Anaerobacterium chartisolvens TaxID=1297424 RepID=A0A369BKD2_9FIRM|nr:mannose-6-phosphate isomerase, class I [Anaerobacterium chartisolvens]RCX21036.1 mannose-6-phosphate isomerase type 1 [Anaerobacterium chartisolvens]
MLYPLKFNAVFKDYIWGGRNFQKLGKRLPEGIVAESWEISCHPDGVSTVANGSYEGLPLPGLVKKLGRKLIGCELPDSALEKFPLLVKLIDANDKLSVQVHPEDQYAAVNENGELGKNEMWYIISAKPGAKLIYDIAPGVTKASFAKAVGKNKIEACLKYIEVFPGDFLNIPAGLVHAIGEGIVLAEIQQTSNTTYRLYDYNRTDKNGNKRTLHIEKALDVIDFDGAGRKEKYQGLSIKIAESCYKTYKIANKYFCVELYDINGTIEENADGSRFCLYVFIEGEGRIEYQGGAEYVSQGQSVLIPAFMGGYHIRGNLKALKSYVPDLNKNVLEPLENAGYSKEDIFKNVSGLE